jgi:hypothetical protein
MMGVVLPDDPDNSPEPDPRSRTYSTSSYSEYIGPDSSGMDARRPQGRRE